MILQVIWCTFNKYIYVQKDLISKGSVKYLGLKLPEIKPYELDYLLFGSYDQVQVHQEVVKQML